MLNFLFQEKIGWGVLTVGESLCKAFVVSELECIHFKAFNFFLSCFTIKGSTQTGETGR